MTKFNNFRREIEFGFLKSFLEPINLKDKKVLDIACGNGLFLKKLPTNNSIRYGIDINENNIKKWKKIRSAEFLISSAEILPFRNCSFDIACSNCALEHFEDGLKALDEIARVLKRNGFLFVSTESTTESLGKKFNDTRRRVFCCNALYSIDYLTKIMPKKIEILQSFYFLPYWLYRIAYLFLGTWLAGSWMRIIRLFRPVFVYFGKKTGSRANNFVGIIITGRKKA